MTLFYINQQRESNFTACSKWDARTNCDDQMILQKWQGTFYVSSRDSSWFTLSCQYSLCAFFWSLHGKNTCNIHFDYVKVRILV